jgi:hypothetical protein
MKGEPPFSADQFFPGGKKFIPMSAKKRKTGNSTEQVLKSMQTASQANKEIATSFYFASDSNPNKPPYETLVYVDGSISCNCPGWTFKAKRLPTGERTCRHTRLVIGGLAEQSAIKVVNYRPVRAFNPLAPGAASLHSIHNHQNGEPVNPSDLPETKRQRRFNLE